jgi:hypothetical protein
VTTYGELIGQAGADVHAGLIGVLRYRFADADEARNIVGAYYGLLHALRVHAWELIDPRHIRARDLLNPTARDRADVAFPDTPASVDPDVSAGHILFSVHRHSSMSTQIQARLLTNC